MTVTKVDHSHFQRWEINGVVFIIVIGSFLHFLYELSGNMLIFAIIGAVNESVWEHLKLGFWPAFFYAVLELKFIKSLKMKSFIIAKAISMYFIPITIVILFYTWEGATGIHSFLIDGLIFVVAVSLGQVISYQLTIRERFSKKTHIYGLFSIVFLIIAFTIFTFFPLHLPIFQDSTTSNYGVP
ncbi:MAG: DUF6512 family protein [Candidatus Hodarchaeota archaeon]